MREEREMAGSPTRRAVQPVLENLEGRRLMSASPAPIYLINTGGAAPYTDHGGQVWAADNFFTSGTGSNTPFTVQAPGNLDPVVYYDRRTGPFFSYNFPIANGSYNLRLFFTDPIYHAPGQRVFDVGSQGKIVLNHFDIIGAGGGKAPIYRDFPVTVTNGVLNVNFIGDNGGSATVSGIEVLPPSATPTPTPTPIPTPTPSNGDHPSVLNVKFGSSPATTNINTDAFAAADIEIVHSGKGIDRNTVNSLTVQLYETALGPSHPVLARRNIDGAGGEIVDQPINLLKPNTQYTFVITGGVKDLTGSSILPFTTTFKTGTGGPTPNPAVHFTKVAQPITNGNSFTCVTSGPDGRLWASTYFGKIFAFPVKADGNLGTPQTFTTIQSHNGGGFETITGITFDPASTASNPILWVDHTQYAPSDGTDFTGKITRLSGPNLGVYQDYVVGLPRSVRDHQTEQGSFGPDGALYVSQASNTGLGGPDPIWGFRSEHLLNAAILRVDTKAIAQRIAAGQGPLNVKTIDAGGPYNPYAAGAPVTLYATGVRNAYDPIWANVGGARHLYAPTNGSAAGSTVPAPPGHPELGIANIPQTEFDWLFDVKPGKYYGHPDPARGQYILNAGNADGNKDNPLELPEYPVGTKPDPNYQKPVYTFGPDYSPNGGIQYHGNAFGGALDGHLLITRYSAGKDIIDLTPNRDGSISPNVHVGSAGLTGLGDPLSLTEAPNGDLFVAEYGTGDIVRLCVGAPAKPSPTPTSTTTKPHLALSTTAMSFTMPRGGGGSVVQPLTITNTGNATLVLPAGAMKITGFSAAEFVISQSAPPAGSATTLAPGASLTMGFRYWPPPDATLGLHTATLNIMSNDPDHPLLTVALSGTAT